MTTIEIKSGYGLDKDNELKILRVARALGKRLGINVRTTLLAAHAVPPEFKDRPDDYINNVCDEILPAAATPRGSPTRSTPTATTSASRRRRSSACS